MSAPRRVAALDLGSNTLILLIAERTANGWRRVEEHAEIARISQGLDASGVLSEEAVARASKVLAFYRQRIEAQGCEAVVTAATAPFRRAKNGNEVAVQLSEVLGAPINVVSGEHEAQLSLLATQRSFPGGGEMLIIDIGGASTELIHVQASGDVQKVSLDVGVVRLTERCITAHPIAEQECAAVVDAVQQAIAEVPWVNAQTLAGVRVVGVAGTATTLAAALLALDPWDPDRVHGFVMPTREIARMADVLAQRSVEERTQLAGIPAGRADVLPAGAMLLHTILAQIGATEVVVSDRGVRWGRLYEAFGA